MRYDKREESLTSELSKLYKSRGFKRYKPSCFEEYSLYQENKDFLIGKNVITFSDLGGKLMAMRPDVTLSLIRHIEVEDGATEKFYYNEKVYRQATGGKDYKEISQTGVEVVGVIDLAVEAELTLLICDTLSAVNEDYILDVSHMGYTEGLLKEFGDDGRRLSEFLKSKNLHDFDKLATERGYSEEQKKAFKVAISSTTGINPALASARKVALNDEMVAAVDELEKLCAILQKFGYGDKLRINFSAAGNAEYYNGVIYNGYLSGIPHCVLTGGRYDKLLEKFGKKCGAVGFALYLGEIERYLKNADETVDFLVIYDDKTYAQALELMQKTVISGQSVRLSRIIPNGVNYKKLIDLAGEGVRK